MRCIPDRDTQPELVLRRELFRRGYRYRKNVRGVPGSPDILFTRTKVAVFIDGDFWHGREWKLRGYSSLYEAFAHNADFWVAKITANVERDRRVNQKLEELGYKVVRLWALDVQRDPSGCADLVAGLLVQRRRRTNASS